MRVRTTTMMVAITIAALTGAVAFATAAPPGPPQGNGALSHWNKGSATISGPVSPAAVSPANPVQILEDHNAGLKPEGMAAGATPATTSGYELTDAFPVAPFTAPTSASVTYGPDEVQGIKEADGQFVSNHSLQDLEVFGTCTANPDCESGTTPVVEITLSTGQSYCAPGLLQCFAVFPWRNNEFFNDRSADNPYVEVTGGLPDNGTAGPPPGNSDSYGYALVGSNLEIMVDGTEVGYFPLSWWGGSFGPVSSEGLQSEAYEANTDWGTEPYPSLDYTFSNYTDNTGVNSFGTPNSETGYTLSNESGTGYQISGGANPETTGGYWPIELNTDDSPNLCLYDESTTNGSPIISGNCDTPGPGEEWDLNSSGYFVNQKSGKCLEDPGDNTTPGTAVVIEPCATHFILGQTWTTVQEPNGYTWYKDYSGTVCLENKNGVLSAGNPIVVGTCSYPAPSELFDASYYP